MYKTEESRRIGIRKKIALGKRFFSPALPAIKCSGNQIKYIDEFNGRVRNKSIQFEAVSCLCGSRRFDLIARVDRYNLLQDTVICVECGLVQANPRMTEKEYENFYASDLYRICYEGEDYLSASARRYTLGYGGHIFQEVNKVKRIGPEVSVLEIGAGGGWNLLPFMQAQARVLGIDYSPSLTQLGSQRGIPMRQGSFKDIPEQYDVIIINHVLEHFLRPLEALDKIKKHLRDGGIIYIAVPNILNFDITQLQNAHTYYFTPYTLEYYCNQAGLELLNMDRAEMIHLFGIFRMSSGNSSPKMKNRKQKINFSKTITRDILKRLFFRS